MVAIGPIFTTRYFGPLPDIHSFINIHVDKQSFLPTEAVQQDDDDTFLGIESTTVQLPKNLKFSPAQRDRYFVFSGKLSVNFGSVYLGTTELAHFRSPLNREGRFTLGPIRYERFTRLYLYYVLRNSNVNVVYNDGRKVKPVKIRVALVNLTRGSDRRTSFDLGPIYSWKREAVDYFREFTEKLRNNPELRNRTYRIEYMKGLEEKEIHRDGTHYLLPLPND
jgi:hypothetical protein